MRILYGVPSEGMGHATRSRVVINYLLQKQADVRIATSDRAFTFLQQHFGDRVLPIEGLHLSYKNAQVSVANTVLLNIKSIPKQIIKNAKTFQTIMENFQPDLIISDFESFTYWYAIINRIPFISIDNMQVIDRAKLDISIPLSEKGNYLLAKSIIKAKVPGAKHYFISSFFMPTLRKKNTSYVAPILREEIISAKKSSKNHILVYQTSSSQQELIPILQSLPKEKFFVFGFNKEEQFDNVQLKKFSEADFIDVFASAKAVISNGGFSLISEAVFLRKPICSVPIANQFEQFVNASYIEKLNYGRHLTSFTPDGIKAFLYDLPFFNLHLSSYHHDGNAALYEGIGKWMK